MTIVPQSDDKLLGQITNAVYGKTDQVPQGDDTPDLSKLKAEYNEWPMDKRFEINLEKNGTIRSLLIHSKVAETTDELNQWKFIVAQFQVSAKPLNLIESETDHTPEGGNNVYKVMESTFFGECETTYDISPISDRQSLPERAHLSSLQDDDRLFKIEKTKNLNNCVKHGSSYVESDSKSDSFLRTRIIISGDLNDYTIQSSYASSKEDDFTVIIEVTLESVDDPQIEQEDLVTETFINKVEDNDRSQVNVLQSNTGKCTKAIGE